VYADPPSRGARVSLRRQQQNLLRNAELMLRVITADREVDVAKIAPAVDAFTKAFEEAKAWTEQNKAEADKVVSWGTLMTDTVARTASAGPARRRAQGRASR
jgi:ABC-type nitrate/sulfonate/bicarbonate transport system substrate-binding protein